LSRVIKVIKEYKVIKECRVIKVIRVMCMTLTNNSAKFQPGTWCLAII
jgi:hypothetical protein